MDMLVTACETIEENPSKPPMTKKQALAQELVGISKHLIFLHALVLTIKLLVNYKESALFAKHSEKFQHETLLTLFKTSSVYKFSESKLDFSWCNRNLVIKCNLKYKLTTFLCQAMSILRTYKTTPSMVLFTDNIASLYDEDLKTLIRELGVLCNTLEGLWNDAQHDEKAKRPHNKTSAETSSDNLNPTSKRIRLCKPEEAPK